jgi:hypothetical protein
MKSENRDSEIAADSSFDKRLGERLRAEAAASNPIGLTAKVRQRIARRTFQRRAAYLSCAVLALLTIALVLRPAADGQPAVVTAEVDDELLNELFAPPPIASLSVLEHRQQAALGALNQLAKRSEGVMP